jgi:hypothetical protein
MGSNSSTIYSTKLKAKYNNIKHVEQQTDNIEILINDSNNNEEPINIKNINNPNIKNIPKKQVNQNIKTHTKEHYNKKDEC